MFDVWRGYEKTDFYPRPCMGSKQVYVMSVKSAITEIESISEDFEQTKTRLNQFLLSLSGDRLYEGSESKSQQ